MKVLVLNCGSSSIKYQLIQMPKGQCLAKGLVERIGEEEGRLKHRSEKGEKILNQPFENHSVGLQTVFDLLTDNDPIQDIAEISAVGHRIVHGGEALTQPTIANDEIVEAIRATEPLAPLHTPSCVLGLEVARKLLPQTPMVCVFDTAFHQTMPPKAYLYAIPYDLYESDRIRRYGFHGTSHEYVAKRYAEIAGKKLEDTNVITCHLGNGASITAIKGGKCVDTSMGFSPLEGLVMGTRSGDIDPAIQFYLARTKGYDTDRLDQLLNKESGLLGLSNLSNDCRIIEDKAIEGDAESIRTLDVYSYRIRKYIGSYLFALDGKVDAVLFTAGVGENSPYIREVVCRNLDAIGIKIDAERNNVFGKEQRVTTDDSSIEVWVIPTNEELSIAQQTYAAVKP